MFEDIHGIASEIITRAERAQARARAEGSSERVTEQLYVAEFSLALNEAGPRAALYVDNNCEQIANKIRRESVAFEARLLDRWKEPLDRYLAITFLGISYLNYLREVEDDDDRENFTLIVLTDLAARACRVTNAIYHLLSGGFALDALARARSVHELAVTAYVIGEKTPSVDQHDIAQRFLKHDHVGRYKDAVVYQENALRLGMERLTEDEIQQLRTNFNDVVAQYGDSFKTEYGWASDRLGMRKPNFSELEKHAQLSHLRGYYKWASHEVHAGARGLGFNEVNFRGAQTRIVNRSNHHLADPAQIALIALSQCMTVVLEHSAKGPTGLLYVQTMCEQAEKACNDLVRVQLSIDEEEALMSSTEDNY